MILICSSVLQELLILDGIELTTGYVDTALNLLFVEIDAKLTMELVYRFQRRWGRIERFSNLELGRFARKLTRRRL